MPQLIHSVALALSLMGGIAFDAQELPGIQAGTPAPLTGERNLNFRHADLDGDGAPDLLLSNGAYLQRDGRFPTETYVALPAACAAAKIDVWGSTVYLLTRNAVVLLSLTQGAWETVTEAPIPPDAPAVRPQTPGRGLPQAASELQRFLHDLDGDGVPEVVVAMPAGLHVMRLVDGACTSAGVLAVLPPLRIAPSPPPALWPETRRRIRIPARHAACSLHVNGTHITVLEEVRTDGHERRFRQYRYGVAESQTGAFRLEGEPEVTLLPVVPGAMAPCRLNEDESLDYAHIAFQDAGALPVRVPAYTVQVSIDGGETFTQRRGQAHYPQPPLIDFDGDGDLDIVTEETDLYSSGLWAWFSRMAGRSWLKHTVRVYAQGQGRFSRQAALEKTVHIALPAPPVFDDALFRRYRGLEGPGVLTFTGDYNGDGYKDLLIHDQEEALAVYLAAGFGFGNQADARIRIGGLRGFAPADVNGDGRDDVITQRAVDNADGTTQSIRTFVYFAREVTP